MYYRSKIISLCATSIVVISCQLFLVSMQLQASTAEHQHWTSSTGLYRVTYTPSLNPIVINQIHSWVLHIETTAGEPVTGAEITLEGGMPMHNHGLPTQPRIMQIIGDGDYMIEGMRFHMMGQWEITITITTQDDSDTVVVPLKL